MCSPSDELSHPHPSHLRRDTMRRKDDAMSADTRLEELGERAGRGRRAGVLGAGGAAPAGAARALLPDARVVRGRRGHRAGDVPPPGGGGDLRGAVDVPGLAVPDRHQRLPGPARQAPPEPATGGEVLAAALPGPAARRAARGRRGRAGDRRRRAGDDRAGVSGRGPAPRAAPAGRTDPAGCSAGGEGRRGTPRGLRQLREQRVAACPRRHAEHLPAERQDWTGGEEDAGRASWCAAIPTPAWPRTSTGSPPCCGTTSAARCRPRRACTSAATRW